MRFKIKIWLLPALCAASAPLHAGEAELYLNDETVQGRYATEADLIGLRAGELSLDVLVNEEDDLLGALGLDFAGQPAGATPWTFSAGPKLYVATLDVADDNFLAVGLGGTAGYDLGTRWPSQVTGQLYYAPKITSFGDSEDLLDAIVRFEMAFVQRVTGFVGYRLLEVDLDDGGGEYEIDDDLHVGVRLSF